MRGPRRSSASHLIMAADKHTETQVDDVGALQIGIGVTALVALMPINAPAVFLGGFLLGG